MFELYRRIKWLYQKFQVSVWLPFLALISYTILGAFIFQWMERERDERTREHFRNQTSYALDQVLERMLEVRCHDQMVKVDRTLQIEHAKHALFWFLDHLNLTEVIEERTDDTPWTWLGSMFYAGQLYTTIGYGYPTTRTTGGRVASIFYILFGIPIFLIILKDMGRLLSRALRKLYKRLRTSKKKIVEVTPIRKLSLARTMHNKISGQKDDKEKSAEVEEMPPEKENKINARLHSENSFPISIALCILLIWILFSAGLLSLWEQEWGFMTSVYFFFVSISTVGLGDIVFDNPDMMIYNFALILVGLALLSMCFNLIQVSIKAIRCEAQVVSVAYQKVIAVVRKVCLQAALERLLDRLLEEYIEEIEKMAEIVAHEDACDEEAIPIEFKMTGNLLTLPMKRVTNETGFFAEAKGWMAGKIANNLIASRLGGGDESSSSDEEDEDDKDKPKDIETAAHIVSHNGSTRASIAESRRSSMKHHHRNRYQLRQTRPLMNTIRTLDKIKANHGDFRAMVFSKFIQSDKLNRLVDENPHSKMVTTACQTEPEETQEAPTPRLRVNRGRFNRKDSNVSFTSLQTNSMFLNDDDSLGSAAYCDVKFDYSTEISSPTSHQRSSLSILKMEDDEPELPSKLTSVYGTWNPIGNAWKSPPQLRVETNLAAVHELPTPLPTSSPKYQEQAIPIQKYPSASECSRRWKSEDELDKQDDDLERLRTVCGLIPHDFDDRSISSKSTSTMVDSGYDRSMIDDSKKLLLTESTIDEHNEEKF